MNDIRNLTTKAGDTLIGIAMSELGSSDRWREVATALGQNPLEGIVVGKEFNLNTAVTKASSVLSSIGVDTTVVKTLSTAVSEVNNVLKGDTASILNTIGEVTGVRNYGEAIKLVDWLL